MQAKETLTPDEFKAILVELGMSQRELADHLDMDATSMTRWATGKTTIPVHIAKYLHMLRWNKGQAAPRTGATDAGSKAAARGTELAVQLLSADSVPELDALLRETLFELFNTPRLDRAIPAFVDALLPVVAPVLAPPIEPEA